MTPPHKKTTLPKVSVPPDGKVAQTVAAAKKKPWLTLAVVASVPLLLLLFITVKGCWVPFKPAKKKVPQIEVSKTPTQLADEATDLLRRKDTQGFLTLLSTQISDPNIVNTKGDPLIVMAATLGNYTAVEELIMLGVDVNQTNAFTKDTALMRSLYGGHTQIAQRLIYSGANINAVNNYKHSPLFIALEKNNIPLIDLFLTSGVKEGLTPAYLLRAVAAKNQTGVLTMLKGGVSPNITNSKGNTPLIISASLGDEPNVQHLLAYRADTNVANKDGNTALIYAARYNHPQIIKLLLLPQTMQTPVDVNAQNKLGETALYWGAARGYVEVVKRLLAAGADPTIAANNGLVPYAVAQKNGRTEVLEWFNKDIREVENAVIAQDNAQLLAQKQAQEEKDSAGDDIFEATAKGNRARVEELLLQDRSLLTAKNKRGLTPFLVAVANNQQTLADFYLGQGINLFEASAAGNALHVAVSNNQLDMLKYLVKKARQSNQLSLMLEYKTVPAKGVPALTPLGFAARQCRRDIYKYLVSVGAKEGLADQAYSPVALLAKCPAK